MIRVGLVDDQTLVRQGLRSLLDLTPDLRVELEAGDGAEALRGLRHTPVDVLLLDVRMPAMSGPQLLRALAAQQPLPPTIILTTFDDDDAVLESMRAGAKGFLLKDISLDRLAEAVRTVASGGTLVQPALTERALQALREGALGDPPVGQLSRRELEILRLLAGGYSNREIASALGIAEGTVKNHTSSILTKLDVRDRTRAVFKALALGYLS
jgi:DNA-binding NarL/FixJ family response regulator